MRTLERCAVTEFCSRLTGRPVDTSIETGCIFDRDSFTELGNMLYKTPHFGEFP